MFSKKGFLKNFTEFTGKHLYWSLFFNKVAGTPPVAAFDTSTKKEKNKKEKKKKQMKRRVLNQDLERSHNLKTCKNMKNNKKLI